MKRFEVREVREAETYAATGGQALHVWRPNGYENNTGVPAVFRRNAALWAHLFDQDRDRLVRTARRLGVRVIKIDREGQPGQHIDLCGGPLRRALAECEPEDRDGAPTLFDDRATG